MAKKKQKYYVVWKGKQKGVYDNWADCKAQIDGFPSPLFKSFLSREVAFKAITEKPDKYLNENYNENLSSGNFFGKAVVPSLTVDAACSGNPGKLEYQGVDLPGRRKIFHQGPFPMGTVNIGEFLALVHGIAYLKQQNNTLPIYSDSMTALAWVRNKAIKTNLERTAQTEQLFILVDRALEWLKKNTYSNKLLKWDTAHWGEIPADFDRK